MSESDPRVLKARSLANFIRSRELRCLPGIERFWANTIPKSFSLNSHFAAKRLQGTLKSQCIYRLLAIIQSLTKHTSLEILQHLIAHLTNSASTNGPHNRLPDIHPLQFTGWDSVLSLCHVGTRESWIMRYLEGLSRVFDLPKGSQIESKDLSAVLAKYMQLDDRDHLHITGHAEELPLLAFFAVAVFGFGIELTKHSTAVYQTGGRPQIFFSYSRAIPLRTEVIQSLRHDFCQYRVILGGSPVSRLSESFIEKSTSRQESDLLNLPGELRNQIYDLLLPLEDDTEFYMLREAKTSPCHNNKEDATIQKGAISESQEEIKTSLAYRYCCRLLFWDTNWIPYPRYQFAEVVFCPRSRNYLSLFPLDSINRMQGIILRYALNQEDADEYRRKDISIEEFFAYATSHSFWKEILLSKQHNFPLSLTEPYVKGLCLDWSRNLEPKGFEKVYEVSPFGILECGSSRTIEVNFIDSVPREPLQ